MFPDTFVAGAAHLNRWCPLTPPLPDICITSTSKKNVGKRGRGDQKTIPPSPFLCCWQSVDLCATSPYHYPCFVRNKQKGAN
jgi:hypothetical protein